MKYLKKGIVILLKLCLVLLLTVYFVFYNFSKPKTDIEVQEAFTSSSIQPVLEKKSFRGLSFRKLSMQKEIDTAKTTLVFVHGTPGSLLDFKRYMADSLLQTKFNMISYDRIGYAFDDEKQIKKTIDFEVQMLKQISNNLQKLNTILVGYSYGGPIALAVKEKYKKTVLLAPAIYSEAEYVPGMIQFYKWKLTRFLVPKIWKSASEEKLAHVTELKKYESNWSTTLSEVISIHGTTDGIVPYKNSLLLKKQFQNLQFELIPIENAGHGLVWSNFEQIKREFLKLAD